MTACVLGWMECHPGMASWAQGIGTFVAIVVALGLGLAQLRHSERLRKVDRENARADRKERQKAVAALVYGELLSVTTKLNSVEAGYTPLETPRIASWHRTTCKVLYISEQKTLMEVWPMMLCLDGPLLTEISKAITALAFFNSLVLRLQSIAEEVGNHEFLPLPQEVRQLIDLAKSLMHDLDKIAPKLRALHGDDLGYEGDLFMIRQKSQ